jgi:hypothetical protein
LREAVGVVVWDIADLEDMVVSGQIEWEWGTGLLPLRLGGPRTRSISCLHLASSRRRIGDSRIPVRLRVRISAAGLRAVVAGV